MEAKYLKATSDYSDEIIGVYKVSIDFTACIYSDGSFNSDLDTQAVLSKKYKKATKKEFDEFRKMAIKKLQSL